MTDAMSELTMGASSGTPVQAKLTYGKLPSTSSSARIIDWTNIQYEGNTACTLAVAPLTLHVTVVSLLKRTSCSPGPIPARRSAN